MKTKDFQLNDILNTCEKSYKYVAFLNSNKSDFQSQKLPPFYLNYDWILACSNNAITLEKDVFSFLEKEEKSKKWLFGHFAYDIKNQIEELDSKH